MVYPNDEWAKLFGLRVLQRADAFWLALWNNRIQIAEWSSHRPSGIGEHPVLVALRYYYHIYNLTCVPVSLL